MNIFSKILSKIFFVEPSSLLCVVVIIPFQGKLLRHESMYIREARTPSTWVEYMEDYMYDYMYDIGEENKQYCQAQPQLQLKLGSVSFIFVFPYLPQETTTTWTLSPKSIF